MANFFPISGGLQILNDSPVDSRQVVDDEAGRLGLPSAVVYEGLAVYQKDVNQIYVLTDISEADGAEGWNSITSNSIETITFSGGVLTITLEDGQSFTFDIPGLRETNPIVNNGDGTYTFHFQGGADPATFTTEDFQAKDIESATGVASGDDVVITWTRKDTTTFQTTVADIRGPQGLRGFQGAYPILVYRVGTVTSDYTGDLTSSFDTDAVFSQDNGTPTDWLANRSGVLADGEIYWVRQAIVDPSLVTEGSTTLTLTWGTPFQEESGAGGATAGVIEYTNGAGGTLEVAQWIGTIGQYNALTDGVKNSEILFTITNDQTEVSEAGSGAYGDSDVQSYLDTNTYVGGLTATAAEINLLDGKVDADLMNTQLSETDIANFGFTKDTNTNLSKTDITNFGFVADATTIAGYGITDALDGALLQPDLGVSGAATLVTTTSDASEVHTQGTLPVANLVQQEGAMLGVGRAAAAGNIELQNASGNSQFRMYSPNNGSSVIQFRNTSLLESSIRQNNDTGVFDIFKDGGSAMAISPTAITFDRPVSGGGVLAVRTYTEYIDLHNDFANLPAHTMIHFTGHLPIFYNNTTVPAPIYFATNAGGNDFFAFYDEADIIPNLANYDGTNGVGSGLSVARTGVTLSDATGTEFRDSEDNIYQINGVGGDANYFRTTATLVANITDSQVNGGSAIADVPHTGYLFEHATTTAYYMFDGTNLLRLTT